MVWGAGGGGDGLLEPAELSVGSGSGTESPDARGSTRYNALNADNNILARMGWNKKRVTKFCRGAFPYYLISWGLCPVILASSPAPLYASSGFGADTHVSEMSSTGPTTTTPEWNWVQRSHVGGIRTWRLS